MPLAHDDEYRLASISSERRYPVVVFILTDLVGRVHVLSNLWLVAQFAHLSLGCLTCVDEWNEFHLPNLCLDE